MVSLHNYTSDQGSFNRRWTKREVSQDHERRAFSLHPVNSRNHLWVYRPYNQPYNPVTIILCYDTAESRDELHRHVQAAVCRWHTALGHRRGVKFAFAQVDALLPLVCRRRQRSSNFGNLVRISWDPYGPPTTTGMAVRGQNIVTVAGWPNGAVNDYTIVTALT